MHAGNFASRQRKLQQEQTQNLFPPIFNQPSTEEVPAKTPGSQLKAKQSSKSLTSSASSTSSRLSCRSSESYYQSAPGSTHCHSPFSSHSSPTPLQVSFGAHQGSKSINIPPSIWEVEEQKEGGVSGYGEGKKATPNSRIQTGKHFLDWNIPKNIVGSRDIKEPHPVTVRKGLSPMHSAAKQEWVDKLVDPKAKSLPFHSPSRPLVREFPCSHANNIKDTFKKYFTANPSTLPHKTPPITHTTAPIKPAGPTHKKILLPFAPSYEIKSLLLNHQEHFRERKLEPSTGALFTQCPRGGTWFVVHPDFRREPGMRGGACTEDC